jgi:serine/threonine protein phosphatase PrpC
MPSTAQLANAGGIRIEFGQATDSGLDPHKQVNEDACGYGETSFGHLFVVCDGMGGHVGGKQASELAIRTVFEVVQSQPAGRDARQVLVEAVEEAARRVYQFGGPAENLQRPGSTCVAVLLHDGQADTVHVGDSRAYAIRGQQIYRLTRDHSMVQNMIDQGLISEQEAIGHPDSNKITRALGMTAEVEAELREEAMELFDGDVFVLATDGLTDVARNDDILITVTEYLKDKDVQAVCDELVALANRRGGPDNITVQVIRVLESGGKGQKTLHQVPNAAAGQPHAPALGPGGTSPGAPAPMPPPPPVPTTVDDAGGGRSTTVLQEPEFEDEEGPTQLKIPIQRAPGPHGVAPTYVDPQLGDSGPHRVAPHAGVARSGSVPMMVVVAMAGFIGLLVVALLWALFLR